MNETEKVEDETIETIGQQEKYMVVSEAERVVMPMEEIILLILFTDFFSVFWELNNLMV